jgi:hypothetical protein
LGGAGGPVRLPAGEGEYEGIFQDPDVHSYEIVPTKAWNRLKHAIDAAGLRMEYQADYRAENERLRTTYGLPLRGKNVLDGYEREVWLFKRWHLRIWKREPTRWPWQSLEAA